MSRMTTRSKARTIIIHDEVHGLGEPSSQAKLRGQHSSFGYTLGLSATPEREYDDLATAFIKEEVGGVVYQFGLREAIERGILVEFDYQIIEYDLTPGDRARIQAVYAKKAARQREGKPMSREEVWIELSKVYKTAEEKIPLLASHLSSHPDTLDRCVIFADTRDHVEPLYEVIHRLGKNYSQYFAEDAPTVLERFANGDLDCLITCHKLSQGIDIPDLRTVVLVSSARSMLETIHRFGGCLRSNPSQPNKRALVIDFCRSDAGEVNAKTPTADALRVDWLSELATIKTLP